MRFIGMTCAALTVAAELAAAGTAARAQSGEPIKIGFSMPVTGPLSASGKPALLAMRIWEEGVNATGGLLGRPVKLITYDDQSNPSNVPGIYTKLLEIDRVDLIVGSYGTNLTAPALPIAIQKNKVILGILATAINAEFKYPRYFSMAPAGPQSKIASTLGFFELAMAQNPKPQTVALASVDAEFGRNSCDGARENAKAAGLRIVYERSYPPTSTDLSPVVRGIQATNPDLLVICSYPLDSVAMIRAINETGFKAKMIGGAMVGPQITAIKMQLGPLLNGIVNFDMWLPAKTLMFTGSQDLLDKYQARAGGEGVDPLGYFIPPWAFSYLQVLGEAVQGTKSLDDGKLADYIKGNAFDTVVGRIEFGPDGEWKASRVLQVQYRDLKSNDLDEFKDMSKQIIVSPIALKTGEMIYPLPK
jgi:branched-chain amino acid transport system substrate-binding protein